MRENIFWAEMIVPRCTIVLVQKLAIHKLFHIKQKKEKKKKKKKK